MYVENWEVIMLKKYNRQKFITVTSYLKKNSQKKLKIFVEF